MFDLFQKSRKASLKLNFKNWKRMALDCSDYNSFEDEALYESPNKHEIDRKKIHRAMKLAGTLTRLRVNKLFDFWLPLKCLNADKKSFKKSTASEKPY